MENQNQWERLAAKLHGEWQGPSGQQNTDDELSLEQSMERILHSGKDVRKIREFQPSEMAWIKLKKKLNKGAWMSEWLKYAAVATIAVMLTIVASYFAGDYRYGDQYAVVSSPIGQITNLTLFDGTNVWLNAGSSLKYKKSFNQSDREVYLEGEALFDVVEDKSRSFIVHAGNTRIKVHGTIFDVRAYSNMPTIETVLLEGSVEFINKGKPVFMKPGEHLLFSSATGKITKSEINTAEYTAWKGGKIFYNNKTLEELTVQLERWYEVRFRFASEELKNYRFSGVINKDKSLDYTLNIIEEINKVKFKTDKEEIVITALK